LITTLGLRGRIAVGDYKYRKRPVVIEAFQYRTDGPSAVPEWFTDYEWDGDVLLIRTLEGTMLADPDDWIIRGVKGEIYPCKPDIFAAT